MAKELFGQNSNDLSEEEQLLAWLRKLSSYVAENGSLPWISQRERLLRRLLDMAYEGYTCRQYSYEHYEKLHRAIYDMFEKGLTPWA